MTLIQHIELGSAQSTITFSSIPQTYTDLVLITSLRTTRSGGGTEDSVKLEFNGVTTAYSGRWLRGDGANTNSNTFSTALFLQNQNSNDTTSNTFSNASVYIPNYTLSTNKSLTVENVNENNGATAWASIVAGLWSNTAAITSLTLTPNVGPNFAQYSSATLYGVLKGTSNGVTVV
jgi:hypothetical protein